MTQLPTSLTIERIRGDTFPFVFTLSDSSGNPIDITSFTFLLTVDPSEDPPNADNNLFVLTGSIIDAVNGKVEFAPSAVQADNIGEYFFDVQMTDASSAIRTIVKGPWTFTQDITK